MSVYGSPLWWAENHDTGEIIAFIFGRRTTRSLQKQIDLLVKNGIEVSHCYTDYWCRAAGADLLPKAKHQVGKKATQSIERKHRFGDPT